jgi:hypothetical protein
VKVRPGVIQVVLYCVYKPDNNQWREEVASILLIDYENIQPKQLSELSDAEVRIFVFVGRSQSKVPFDLVSSAQKLGDRLEWIQISGSGKNALDFHIAFSIGNLSAMSHDDEYTILSKDTGFDPLIQYMMSKGITCRRINSLVEFKPTDRVQLADPEFLKRAKENLLKVDPKKRPQKIATLTKHLKTAIKDLDEFRARQVVEALFVDGTVTEDGDRVKYHL